MLFVTPFVTLTYENTRGRSLQLGWETPYVITAGNGQENHANNVHGVPAPGRHGESETGSRMGTRHIRLVGEVRQGTGLSVEAMREALHMTFNPTLRGILTSENSQTGVRRWIQCTMEELPIVIAPTRGRPMTFEIMLVALDPFWKGRPLTVNIAQTLKRWSYPMSIPQRGSALPDAMVFGIQHATLETRFMNMGNVESGFTAEIHARTGTVVNPSVVDMETGNQIRLNYTMARHDRIVIVNYLHEKRIELNGENALHLLDAEATRFFLIQVGQNRIGYFADQNISNMQVRVRYTPEYTFVGGYDPQSMIRSPYIAENAWSGSVLENEETTRLINRLVPSGRREG